MKCKLCGHDMPVYGVYRDEVKGNLFVTNVCYQKGKKQGKKCGRLMHITDGGSISVQKLSQMRKFGR